VEDEVMENSFRTCRAPGFENVQRRYLFELEDNHGYVCQPVFVEGRYQLRFSTHTGSPSFSHFGTGNQFRLAG
jgi:hypothetical protein